MAMKPDKLTDKELAQHYGYAYEVIRSNPELWLLFQQAAAGDGNWSKAKFTAAVKNTKWYQNNNQYARTAWTAETTGGADWTEQITAARQAVRSRATALGFELDDAAIGKLARDYLYNGWYDSGRGGFLDEAIGKSGKGVGGEFANVEMQLRRRAAMNGVELSDGWFQSAAKSVASQLTTIQDWDQDIRTAAAGMFPIFKDKIMAGMDAYDLASPYISRMSDVLELDANEIKLNDKYIRGALGGVDDKGNPMAMNMWEFEKQLRKDERWKYTKAANDSVSNVAASVLRMFGFGG